MLLIMAVICFSTSLVYADWSYQVTEHLKPGQKARLDFRPPQSLSRVKVVLRSGKKVIRKKLRKVSAQKTTSVKFKVPSGESRWQVDITGKAKNEILEVRFEFSVVSVGGLKVQLLENSSSLEDGILKFKANRKLSKVELQAYGDEGQLLWEDQVEVSADGNMQTANFDNRDEVPRRLEAKVSDPYGFWLSIRVVRWYTEVPHEDVLFASGSAEIQASEKPKMESAIKEVRAEVDKFRTAMGNPNASVDLQLYVAGYTDTVGDAQDNLKLSRQRAQPIARYFKQKGIVIPILYAGFGERGLLVKTADQVDEAKNRRALYVIANHRPKGAGFPNAQWRVIK